MITYVVDASVAVEYLLRTNLGLKLAETMTSADLLAPELLDVEVLSVLRRAAHLKKVTEERARLAIEDLLVWPVERLSHHDLLLGAWQHRHHVSVYDALYVAASQLYDVTLLTADGPLSRAPALGIVVQNIRFA